MAKFTHRKERRAAKRVADAARRIIFDLRRGSLKTGAVTRRFGVTTGKPSFRTYGHERLEGVIALYGKNIAHLQVQKGESAMVDETHSLTGIEGA